MAYRPPKILVWLALIAAVLLLSAAFAPISGSWNRILWWVGLVALLAFLAINERERHRVRQGEQSDSARISSSDQI